MIEVCSYGSVNGYTYLKYALFLFCVVLHSTSLTVYVKLPTYQNYCLFIAHTEIYQGDCLKQRDFYSYIHVGTVTRSLFLLDSLTVVQTNYEQTSDNAMKIVWYFLKESDCRQLSSEWVTWFAYDCKQVLGLCDCRLFFRHSMGFWFWGMGVAFTNYLKDLWHIVFSSFC